MTKECLYTGREYTEAPPGAPGAPGTTIRLTVDELGLLLDGLNDRAYWALSQQHYRRDGYVTPPGTDDANDANDLHDCGVLHGRLEPIYLALRHPPGADTELTA